MFAFLRCLFNRHEPIRRRVHKKDRMFLGHCKHCNKTITRVRQGLWVYYKDT